MLHLFVDIYDMLPEGLVVNYSAKHMSALAVSLLTVDAECGQLQ